MDTGVDETIAVGTGTGIGTGTGTGTVMGTEETGEGCGTGAEYIIPVGCSTDEACPPLQSKDVGTT